MVFLTSFIPVIADFMTIRDERYHDKKNVKLIQSLVKARTQLEKQSNDDHTFSLPSLSNGQRSRLQSIPVSNEPKIRQNNDIARLSAAFLSKHVGSLNRKASHQRDLDSTFQKSPQKPFLARNPSVSQKK